MACSFPKHPQFWSFWKDSCCNLWMCVVSPWMGDGPWDGIVLCILRLLRFGQIFAGVLRRLARLKLASLHQEMVRDDVGFPGISAPQALSSILPYTTLG